MARTALNRFIGATILLLLLLPAQAPAQGGSLSGTVQDENGAALPGVTISLRGGQGCDCDDCEQREACTCCPNEVAVTNEEGHFGFKRLANGAYRLDATLEGFGSVSTSVEIRAGQTVEVRLTLTEEVLEVDVG